MRHANALCAVAVIALLLTTLAGTVLAQAPGPSGPSAQAISPAVLAARQTGARRLPAGAAWATECVDCPKYLTGMTDRSLRIDAAGTPHLAYGGDSLYYAWYSEGAWHQELVDSTPGSGWYASLFLDASGRPHVSYLGGWPDFPTRYAYRDDAGWHTELVDAEGVGGTYTTLALDAGGVPHIVYSRYLPDEADHLRYAYQDAGVWQIEEITSMEVIDSPSMALDAIGNVHVSFSDWIADRLLYAKRELGSWSVSVVDNTGGEYSSLALDAGGAPNISYYVWWIDSLKYAHWTGSQWQKTVVDGGGSLAAGEFSSLAFDQDGYPHISYHAYDLTSAETFLKRAYKDAGGWQVEVVDSSLDGELGVYTSIAFDPANHPRIAYYDGSSGELQLALHDGSSWTVGIPVDSGARVGYEVSLALDASGNPHVSYRGSYLWQDGHVLYAYRDAGGWHIESITEPGPASNTYPALALDASGLARIAYCTNAGTGALVFASQDAGGWTFDELTSEPCRYTSIALDASGYAHIAFYQGNSEVLYASQSEAGWSIETVDNAGNLYLGATSLALDSAGEPHIGYYDSFARDLRYAYKEGDTWHRTTVDATGDVGQGLSLALDGSDLPRLSYYDRTNRTLRYAYDDGSTWQFATVDTGLGNWGGMTSLQLDTGGLPHIAYYAGEPTYALRYAWHDGQTWVIETVDSSGDMGSYLALGLDGEDGVHLSYFDGTGRDLRYATIAEGLPYRIFLPAVTKND